MGKRYASNLKKTVIKIYWLWLHFGDVPVEYAGFMSVEWSVECRV